MPRPTKKKAEPEVIDLPEIEWTGSRFSGLGDKLIILSGMIGVGLLAGGLFTGNLAVTFFGTILIGVATVAAN